MHIKFYRHAQVTELEAIPDLVSIMKTYQTTLLDVIGVKRLVHW